MFKENTIKQRDIFSEKTLDNLHETVFTGVVVKYLLDDFENDLYEVFEDEDIAEKISQEIIFYGSDDQKRILSNPWSVRKKRLEFLRKKYLKEDRTVDVQGLVRELRDSAKEHNFTIGYHISPFEIIKKNEDWTIEGKEFDDRDNRLMAYYSLDYKNLFRKKRGEYIYIVRAHIGDESDHKRDTSNNWGRAARLAIISGFSLQEVDEKVDEITKRETARK